MVWTCGKIKWPLEIHLAKVAGHNRTKEKMGG